MSELLQNLNEEQFQAVTHIEGPLMIIAGAGTGKTTVVTQRIAWLIEQGHAKPNEILALTFTDKAAGEMEERVDQLLPIGYVDLWISTFHSFCERILREHGLDIGLPTNFKLLTPVDVLLLLNKKEGLFELDYYKPRGNKTQIIKDLAQHFSRAKDELMSPESYLHFAHELQIQAENDTSEDADVLQAEAKRVMELAKAYQAYQEFLLEKQAMDFGDVIYYTIELFRKRPNVLREYRDLFKFVLVDEFQDTNTAQYELVKLLAKPKNNITVVGDDDQAIYKFRGASLANIMNFRKDFPDARNVVLVKNYRSTACVLDHAYKVIRNNDPHRLEVQEEINKALISHREEEGFLHHIHCANGEEEVQTVLKHITELHEQGANWSDFAVLVRTNASADPYINAFTNIGIPFRFLAQSGLYTTPIILDGTSWLKIILQPHNSACFYRILSHPRLGIHEDDIARVSLHARKKSMSIFDVLNVIATVDGISAHAIERSHELLDTLQALRIKSRRLSASELFVSVIKETGMYGDILQTPEYEQVESFGLMQQFLNRIRRFEEKAGDKTLPHFLAELDLERESGEVGELEVDVQLGPDVVNIMTIHASKGLEFRYVFLPKMVEQTFPSKNKKDAITFTEGHIPSLETSREHHLAEERRLFYVALTRAKEGAFLLSSQNYGGKRDAKVSRFVSELNTEIKTHLRATEDLAVDERTEHVIQDPVATFTLPKQISFSQLSDFDLCPLLYKYKQILKIPTFGKSAMSYGNSIHHTLENFMKLYLENQKINSETLPSEADLLRIYEESFIDEWYDSEKDKIEKKEQGKEQLLRLHNDWKKELPKPFLLEQDFTLKIGGIVIKGRIDRIDHCEDGVEIIDYKTGKPKEKLEWKDKRQLIIYQLALEQSFDPPLKVKKLSYLYIENNSKVSFVAREKDIEKLENQIISAIEGIQSSDFAAKPNFACRYCEYRDICPSALT